MARVAVIDYGMGNVQSVVNAFNFIGATATLTRDATAIAEADGLILPGVGAFGDGMKKLRDLNLIPLLEKEVLQKKKPFLGICLGMQLLGTTGLEHGRFEGLNWIAGTVDRLPQSDPSLRIPHIGWNEAKPLPGVFYFVHSYHLIPEDRSVVSGWCDHGVSFCAAIKKDNVWGAQFHPEKSHKDGLRFLREFLHLIASSPSHA